MLYIKTYISISHLMTIWYQAFQIVRHSLWRPVTGAVQSFFHFFQFLVIYYRFIRLDDAVETDDCKISKCR